MERKSRQREEIKRLLAQKNYHPTIEELYQVAKQNIPQLGIATIYRNVEKMLRNNEIIRLEVPGAAARFDGNVEKHYHFRCERCGMVEDVWMDIKVQSCLEESNCLENFEIHDHNLELRGLCPDCKQNKC